MTTQTLKGYIHGPNARRDYYAILVRQDIEAPVEEVIHHPDLATAIRWAQEDFPGIRFYSVDLGLVEVMP